MIIVELTGGLGNQLFQYAFGRTLALRNKCELKLDISSFENYEWHDYSLNPFNINQEIATKKERENLLGINLPIYERIKRKLFKGQPILITENSLLFDSKYLEVKEPAYLRGYWQSEKYFTDFKNEILNDLIIQVKPTSENQKILDQIISCNSISLHIRRGNFVNDESVNKRHGTTSLSYYQEAINVINSKVSNPVYFIFSDDILWVKTNFNITEKVLFVDINDAKNDFQDLRLISSCKHHILANSTFSWWGAWLNTSPEKIVITPKLWFIEEAYNLQTLDLLPPQWMRI